MRKLRSRCGSYKGYTEADVDASIAKLKAELMTAIQRREIARVQQLDSISRSGHLNAVRC